MLSDSVRDVVEDVARGGETIYYGELMEAVGLKRSNQGHRSKFAKSLKEICADTFGQHGFMLCCLVVLKSSGIPNDPFFKYAEELGAKDMDVSRETFWEEQKNLVYSYFES